ncbi:LysR family transcriptional regulator [uncultured Desulfobacter sp.]|uniref:LysR family transcriptional regulator n=1 Tax=uncultured Desulfobacter sp. TaxID=240139 RepID=UPI002AA80051|nr:LysR family transcriptional regulator [uncultured Desulfobacter sp.]
MGGIKGMNSLREVNLNLLVVLHTLLIEGSVSRAGETLGMSQPAVSHALARLREALDDPLFTQTKTGIRPTTRALALQPDLDKALMYAEAVIRGGGEWSPADMQRTFHLAVSDYGAALFLPRMLNDLRQAAPRTDLACIPADHRNIAVQLEAGTIDMGFCIVDTAYQSFCSVPLLTDRFVCLVSRASMPLASGPATKLPLDQYLERPHMVVATSGTPYSEIDAELAKKGLRRRICARLPHYAVAARAVVDTDMVLTLPLSLVMALPERSLFHILDPPLRIREFTYSAIWHPRSEGDRGLSWLRELAVTAGEGLEERGAESRTS